MVFGRFLQTLMKAFALTPEMVAFAAAVAAGLNKSDAYAIIFKPRSAALAAIARAASDLISNNPGITTLIDKFKFDTFANLNQVEQINQTNEKTENEKQNKTIKQFRTKSQVIEGLEGVLPNLNGKERAAVLMQLADLQRLKFDEDNERISLIHYYLPLRCEICPFFSSSSDEEESKRLGG